MHGDRRDENEPPTAPASPKRLQVVLLATGTGGMPDSFRAEPHLPLPAPINVDSEWTLVTPDDQGMCTGYIRAIRAFTHDVVEYVVDCLSPPSTLFLLVKRKYTCNPGEATRALRTVKPHLRDAQLLVLAPWHVWRSPYEGGDAFQTAGPPHLRVKAHCVSRSETDQHPSTWHVAQQGVSIGIGQYIDLQDRDDPLIPVGPVKVVGIRNIERENF